MTQLAVSAALTTSSIAAPTKSADSFDGYAGLQLRNAITKVKDFDKKWKLVAGDTDTKSTHYIFQASPSPAFHGVKVDKLVVLVSKRMQIVVGFALSLVGDRCVAIKKALDAEWGPAMDIGGKNHEVEWEGKRVDASVELDGPNACFVFVTDRGWNDETDELKNR